MASAKQIILITGANSGVGFELASQLLAKTGKHVLLGSRSVDRGQAALRELESRNPAGTVELLQVDVTSEQSIAAAAKAVESKHGRLDALVNNAGVIFDTGSVAQQFAGTFAANATGPHLMVEAFAPLLQKSITKPRIVNVSSGLGSIGGYILNPTEIEAVAYRASKAALNMVTACQSVKYGKPEAGGFRVFAYCPGFVVSGLSGYNKSEMGAKPTSGGAAPILGILEGRRDAEHGGFLHDEDGTYPW